MGLVAVVCRLGCSVACGVLVPRPGIKPTSLALEGGFLTTGPPGESHIHLFELEFSSFADVYPGVGLLDYRVAVLLLLLLLSRFSRVRLCATRGLQPSIHGIFQARVLEWGAILQV